MKHILDLIEKLPEIYQDIVLNGETLVNGKRDCSRRWEMIRHHLPANGVVLDIGSNTGYFAQKIAHEHPNVLVLSFESDPVMCQIQREIFKQEGLYNIIVCQHRLTAEDLEKWAKHAETFSTILALAVLHHFPEKDVKRVWKSIQELSAHQIVEIALPEDTGACGAEARSESTNLVRSDGLLLGRVPSHTSEVSREFYLASSPWGARRNLDAFFGVSHPDRHRFTIQEGKLNGREMIDGANVWNLLHFNIVWPESRWWVVQAKAAYDCLEWKSDVRAWNLLVTATGLKAIDFLTKFPEGDQAEYRHENLKYLVDMFNQMKPIEYEL